MSPIIDNDTHLAPHVEASVWPTAIKWGLISAAVGIVFSLLTYLLGGSDPAAMTSSSMPLILSVISFLVGVAIEVFGLKSYRDVDNGGWLTLGQAIKWALFFGLVAGIVTFIWMIIYQGLIVGDQASEVFQEQMNQAEERGATQEELDMMQTVGGAVSSPFVLGIFGLLWTVGIALFVGLIAGLIMKTEGRRDQYA